MSVPTKENSLAAKVRRVVLFDRARAALGGVQLADALGVSRRAITYKASSERGLSDYDIRAVAEAVDARAAELAKLAADLREMAA